MKKKISLIMAICMMAAALPVTYGADTNATEKSVATDYQADMVVSNDDNNKYNYIVGFFINAGILDEEFAKLYEPEQPLSKEIIDDALSKLTSRPINCRAHGQYVTLKSAAIELVGVYTSHIVKNSTDDEMMKEADRLGILDKLRKFGYGKEITAQVLVQILYNISYIRAYVYNDQYAKSFMDNNEYREISGIVTANEYTALSSKSGVGKNRIMIGAEVFTLENSNGLLGYEVSAIVDRNRNVLSYMLTNKNNTVSVMSYQIKKDADTYFYYDEGDKTKKLRLRDDYTAIYNGELRFRKDSELLRPELGKLTFIDNNEDNVYDVLKTESFKVMKIDSVDRENTVLIDGSDGTKIELDDIDYDLYIDGDEASFQDITNNSVLYYGYSDDSDYVLLYISTETKEGTVDNADPDGTDSVITIDGVVYPSSEERAKEAVVASLVKAYLGAFGRIEYLEHRSGYNYGILKSIYPDDALGDKYLVKYLDENGDISESELSKRCKVYSETLRGEKIDRTIYAYIKAYIDNAYAPKPSGDAYGYGMAAPIFMYKKTDDAISLISLPQAYDENCIGAARKPYILQSAASDPNMIYKSSENLFRTASKAFYATYRNEYYCDNIHKFTNADTTVFDLMINSDNSVDKDRLDSGIVRKASSLTMDPWTYGSFYNLNEGNIAQVMVLYNLRQKSAVDSFIIVSKSVAAVNPETGETGYKITGYKGKTPVEYFMNEETVLNMRMTGFVGDTLNLKPSDIDCGDYMKISLGNNNTILYANVYARGEYAVSDYNLYHDGSNIESPEEKMFGRVKRISSGVLTLDFDINASNGKITTYSYNTYRNGTVYIYDGKNVNIGDSSDICVGDCIYTRLNESSAQETIIWRKY